MLLELNTTTRVCEDTIAKWEERDCSNNAEIPGIIRMIGYVPVNINTSHFGGRITYYRYMKGMIPKEFGCLCKLPQKLAI
jgi:hypothetical protein